jgi:hypothetical protein
MAPTEESSEVGCNLIFNFLGRGEDRSRGGRLDTLEARGAAMAPFGGHVKDARLLLFNQWHVGPQGNPSGNPRIKVSDLRAAELHSGPILGGEGMGQGRREKPPCLAPLGGKQGGKGAAEGNNGGLSGSLPPIRDEGGTRWKGGGNRLPEGTEGRQKARVLQNSRVELPVETAARGGGGGQGGDASSLEADHKGMVIRNSGHIKGYTRAGFKERREVQTV